MPLVPNGNLHQALVSLLTGVSLAYEDAYDTAILVTGDGDFVPAIKRVQKLGKKVENAFFRVSSSNYLKGVCDSSIKLDDFMMDCLKDKE